MFPSPRTPVGAARKAATAVRVGSVSRRSSGVGASSGIYSPMGRKQAASAGVRY